MAAKAKETEGRDESFWREFPAVTDYFAPGIVPLLRYLGLDSKQVMHELGEQIGIKAVAMTADLSLDQMLDEFARVCQAYTIGNLEVESQNPMVIQISNYTVCSQLDGTREMFECAFHEGSSGAP